MMWLQAAVKQIRMRTYEGARDGGLTQRERERELTAQRGLLRQAASHSLRVYGGGR